MNSKSILAGFLCCFSMISCGNKEPKDGSVNPPPPPPPLCSNGFTEITPEKGDSYCVATLVPVNPPNLKVEVTFPTERLSIDTPINVTGSFSDLPTGLFLRFFVNPPGDMWWPQDTPTIGRDNSFSAGCSVGVENDTGIAFVIGILAVTQEQDALIDAARQKGGTHRFKINGPLDKFVSVVRK